MSKRTNRDAAFRARVALGALKGARTVSAMAATYEFVPTMIHRRCAPSCAIGSRKVASALLEGTAGILERSGKAAATAKIVEVTVRDLHPKIRE